MYIILKKTTNTHTYAHPHARTHTHTYIIDTGIHV